MNHLHALCLAWPPRPLQVETQGQLNNVRSDDGSADAPAGDPSTAIKLRAGKVFACKQSQHEPAVKLKSCLSQVCRKRWLPHSRARRTFARQAWAKQRGHTANRLARCLSRSVRDGVKKEILHREREGTCEDEKPDRCSLRWGGTDADLMTEPFRGAWDACSQSSRRSQVGSVTAACRQLLGPLHDHLPPPRLVSKRVEDHVQCAAEMVRLKASASIKTLHHELQLLEWQRRMDCHVTSTLLNRSKPPGIDEQVWRAHLLPHLQEPSPGQRPEKPDNLDDAELWYQAWTRTYESGCESDSDDGSSDSEGPSVARGPAQHTRLTARTDPRMRMQ